VVAGGDKYVERKRGKDKFHVKREEEREGK